MTTATDEFADIADQAEFRETETIPRSPGTSRTRQSSGTTRRRSSNKRLDSLKDALGKQMFQAGAMMALGLPVTGTYVCQQAESFPDAIIELAKTRADWIEALEKVASVGPGITVGRTVLGVAAAMGVDRWHRSNGESGFNPDKRACQFLGVTAAYYAVYQEDESLNGNANGFVPPPHGAFVPVS